MKPHKHAELIKAWADGAVIEFRCNENEQWSDSNGRPLFLPDNEYRIKPAALAAEIAPKWPETTLTRDDVFSIWASAPGDGANACMVLANETISHACETGLIVTREGHDREIETRDDIIEALRASSTRKSEYIAELRADRTERDKAIAEAVRDALVSGVANYSTGCAHYINSGVDLAAIIAEVRP